jgi:hypothetical protein
MTNSAELTREATGHLHLYLRAKSWETEEDVKKRLEDLIRVIEDAHPDLSAQIYDVEYQQY